MLKLIVCSKYAVDWIQAHWVPLGYGVGYPQALELFNKTALPKFQPGTLEVLVIYSYVLFDFTGWEKLPFTILFEHWIV